MKTIGYIRTDLPEKFGLPRQSGIVEELKGTVIFKPPYNVREAFEGIEEFTHLWVLWEFSENIREEFSPTVRPPKLGGDVRKGVFATRSPFRPNPIGLSCVRLDSVEHTKTHGTVLHISGVDMMDGTPVYDIKPYIAYADSRPDASMSFAGEHSGDSSKVEFPQKLLERIPKEKRTALKKLLAERPIPAYKHDSERIYGLSYAGFNIKFRADESTIYVTDVE